jgi:hypothetical protein
MVEGVAFRAEIVTAKVFHLNAMYLVSPPQRATMMLPGHDFTARQTLLCQRD